MIKHGQYMIKKRDLVVHNTDLSQPTMTSCSLSWLMTLL